MNKMYNPSPVRFESVSRYEVPKQPVSILKKRSEYSTHSRHLTVVNTSPYDITVIISTNPRSLMKLYYRDKTVLKYLMNEKYDFSKMLVYSESTKKIVLDSSRFYMTVARKTSEGNYEIIRDNTLRENITTWICEEDMFGRSSAEYIDAI